jgi:hypothetical protein
MLRCERTGPRARRVPVAGLKKHRSCQRVCVQKTCRNRARGRCDGRQCRRACSLCRVIGPTSRRDCDRCGRSAVRGMSRVQRGDTFDIKEAARVIGGDASRPGDVAPRSDVAAKSPQVGAIVSHGVAMGHRVRQSPSRAIRPVCGCSRIHFWSVHETCVTQHRDSGAAQSRAGSSRSHHLSARLPVVPPRLGFGKPRRSEKGGRPCKWTLRVCRGDVFSP